MNSIMNTLSKFKTRKIIVIGDVMLDKYIWGSVKRISPEAPVQVVDVARESYTAGGAANVAMNVAALGGKAEILGIVGNDPAKNSLLRLLEKKGIAVKGMITHAKKPTIQKVRIIAQNQQLLRVDYENKDYVSDKDEQKIIAYISKTIRNYDAVIVSDYAKGIITERVMKAIVKLAKECKKPLIVDPKPKHFAFYSGATLITPNTKEAYEAAAIDEAASERIIEVGEKLKKISGSNILITRGEKGMSLFGLDNSVRHISTVAKEVYDVTGAGDTVVAAISLAIASGAELGEAAIIANHAAGITVGKVGTSTVSVDEIIGMMGLKN
jgi:rfaE bifunctional protein kinase chain/domain